MVMPRSALTAAVVVLLYATECVAAVQEVFMSDYCGTSAKIRVEKSLVLHFSRSTDLPASRVDHAIEHCGLSVAAKDRSNRLILHIVTLHIDFDHADRLHVYESAGQRFHRLSPAAGLYGKYGGVVQISSEGITDYRTHGDTFYLDYEGFPTEEFDGFTILFTEFHDVSSVTGSCFGTYFECKTARMCIDASLQCDNHRNCGEYDGSDELTCPQQQPSEDAESTGSSTLPIALSVGIVATVTFLVVSLAIFLVTRLRRRQIVAGRRQSGSATPEQRNSTVPQENDLNLATLYAPPSYEDVMHSNQNLNSENPPPYDSLVSLHIEEITPPVRRTTRARLVQDESSFIEAPSPTRTSQEFNVSDSAPLDNDKDSNASDNESGHQRNGAMIIPYQRTGASDDILTFRTLDV